MPDAPEDVVRLAEERSAARESRDFAEADSLRDRIVEAGWTVVDAPHGYRLQPAVSERAEPVVRRRA
jgi:cysteinyl-tRNA synthetase